MELFALLVFGHFLGDYGLQSQFMAEAKNHRTPIKGTPWYQALLAHSAIHAGFVGVITGSLWLAIAELTIHFVTDYAKSEGKTSLNVDQSIHIGCKALWAVIAIYMI